MQTEEKPIGFFDSGLGGLSVVKEMRSLLVAESFIYFGDTAHVPYGSKNVAQLMQYATEIGDFLASREIKALVVACNTSSAVSLEMLKERYSFPIIDVIAPGVRAAIKKSRNKKIAVIATQATISSGAHSREFKKQGWLEDIFPQACPLFVPLVEEGKTETEEAYAATREYLEPLKKWGADTLLLGCTHYPFLEKAIRSVMGEEVILLDPARETIMILESTLREKGLLAGEKEVKQEYHVSDAPEKFRLLGEKFLGERIAEVKLTRL